MRIIFNLSEYGDIEDDINDLCENLEPIFTDEDDEGVSLCVSPFRIDVPSINSSYRIGDLFSDGESEGASIVIEYPYEETDVNNYIFWETASLNILLRYEKNIIEDTECIIVFDDDTIDSIDEDKFPTLASRLID